MNRAVIGLLAICLAANLAEARLDNNRRAKRLIRFYDDITLDLSGKRTTDDAESNMLVIEKMLESATGTKKEALEQIFALKSLTDPNSCNQEGTDIVARNDIACRGEPLLYLRTRFDHRIDALVHHYALKHSLVCDQVYQKNCLDLVKNVDEDAYRKVFGLSSIFYYSDSDEQLNVLVEEMKLKKVGDSFVTPHILEKNQERPIEIPRGFDWASQLVWRYLKAVARNEKGKNYITTVADHKLGGVIPNPKIVTAIYNEYLHEPCRKFLAVLKPTMNIYDHNRAIIPTKQQTADLEFRFLNRAVSSCKEAFQASDEYLRKVLHASTKDETL